MTPFVQLEAQKYLCLETFRRNGDPVRTPVWFVDVDGVLYVRTAESTGKYKRIRNNPDVRVALCDGRGKVKGEWLRAEAAVATQDESDEVYRLFEKKYGLIYRLTKIFMRGKNYVLLKIRDKPQ
jgi:PPOX class probable F420-dependent enzyme